MKHLQTPHVLIVLTALIFALLLVSLFIDQQPEDESEPDGPIGEVRLVYNLGHDAERPIH